MAVQTGQEIKTVVAWPGFSGGLRTDLPNTKIPDNAVWDALNCNFDRDSATKRNGYSSYLVANSQIKLIDEWYDANGTQWLIIATVDKIWTYDVISGTLTDRTPSGGLHGLPGFGYSGIGFYGKYYINTCNDTPFYWDSVTATFVALTTTGAPQKALFVIPFADHLMWFNIQDAGVGYQPQGIIWSDSHDGTVYNSGDAALITLEDTNDIIIGAEIVFNYLAIARAKSIYTSFFIGFPFFYQFNRAVEKYGIVATDTFKKTEVYVIGFNSNNIIGFDGSSLDPYIGQAIKSDLLNTVTLNPFIGGSIASFDIGTTKWRLLVSGRADGLLDTEYDFSETYKNWSKKKYANLITAIGFFQYVIYPIWSQLTTQWQLSSLRWNDPLFIQPYPITLYGDSAGNIYIDQAGVYNDNGAAISAYFKTKPSELQMQGWLKELNRLQFILAKQIIGTLTVRVFSSDDGFNFTEATNSPYTLDMTQVRTPFLDVFAVGRWFYLHVFNNNLDETFDIREIRASFIPLTELMEF